MGILTTTLNVLVVLMFMEVIAQVVTKTTVYLVTLEMIVFFFQKKMSAYVVQNL